MKNLLRTTALGLIMTISTFSSPFTVPEGNMFAPARVARQATVSFEDGKFSALVNGKVYPIQSHDVSGLPDTLTDEQLKGFLNHGLITLKKIGYDYGIEATVRGKGGGRRERQAQITKDEEKKANQSNANTQAQMDRIDEKAGEKCEAIKKEAKEEKKDAESAEEIVAIIEATQRTIDSVLDRAEKEKGMVRSSSEEDLHTIRQIAHEERENAPAGTQFSRMFFNDNKKTSN